MARLAGGIHPEQQLLAIARVRRQIFFHSLRTARGAMELVSRVFVSLLLMLGGVFGAVGLGAGAYAFTTENKLSWTALLLWSVFLFWQLFPIMGSVFTETLDLSHLLRFPLSYRSYFLVRLIYGAIDPSSALGTCWVAGIAFGIGLASPPLFLWAVVVLTVFALVNVAMMQAFLTWVERWLAQRRTREIFTILFFLLMIGLQLIGPLAARFGRSAGPEAKLVLERASPFQRVLPPGIAADALTTMAGGRMGASLISLGLLSLYGVAGLAIMGMRVRAQYRGENLSEAPSSSTVPRDQLAQPGWKLPGLPPTIAAVFEKELRYLGRSGPMLLTLVTPVVMLAVFGLGPARGGTFLKRSPDLSYPVGAGYALILLTNLIYNNFGSDGEGVQFFFASPVSFRKVVFGKNLAHFAILLGELAILWLSVSLMFHPPTLFMTLTTFAAVLFAAPVNLAAGNLLSLYSPKRVDFGIFGRQRASQMTVLLSLLIQAVVSGACVGTFLWARYSHKPWLAITVFLTLSVPSLAVYALSLRAVQRLAQNRRETLMAELCRA